MGIRIKANSKAKESVRLYNHISSYIFEQEYDEMTGNSRIRKVLDEALSTLADIIKANR